MVSVIQRGRKLQTLLYVRLGPGAAVLSPEVTRLHLDFVRDSRVPKKFWRRCLPRLKYHNPAIPMTVNQTDIQGTPPTLTVHFASPSSPTAQPLVNTTASAQTSPLTPSKTKARPSTARTEIINMQNKTVSEILTQLMTLTTGKPVKATAEEARQIRELEEFRDKSAVDAERMKAVNEVRKREQAILTQAKGEFEATKDS